MQPGIVKAATDEGDVGKCVEIAEDADAVDENDIARIVGELQTIEPQPLPAGPLLDRREVGGRRLMWGNDKARVRHRTAHANKGRQ